MAESTTDLFEIKPHHCGISVPDIEASIVWYRDMLGFSVAKRDNSGPASAKVAFMKRGDFYIELFEVPGAAPLPDSRREPDQDIRVHGTKHIALVVDDLRRVMAILRKRGVDIARDGSEREQGPRVAFIRDNAGTLLELVSPEVP
jgi:methylmalonyl-CoA/ethylmalonyl-CoA epimerase